MIELSKDDNVGLRCLAVASLHHLSLSDEIKRPIVDAGALGPLLRNSNSKNEDLLMQCAGTIANLTENMENRFISRRGCNGILDLLRGTRK